MRWILYQSHIGKVKHYNYKGQLLRQQNWYQSHIGKVKQQQSCGLFDCIRKTVLCQGAFLPSMFFMTPRKNGLNPMFLKTKNISLRSTAFLPLK